MVLRSESWRPVKRILLGSRIELQVRGAATREALQRADRVEPDSDFLVAIPSQANWLQYRATSVA